ncbi:hypothetical protein I9W82_000263 [Candida metapsilosis]|uniref:Uncharacterized protein n=1 Tax=Candida metapsilosis TaxID=273372 RepID=A0A8H7ZKD5_9ASCO|nr:hypothetical protein I9W82_000263 [Candida metapsilosis]
MTGLFTKPRLSSIHTSPPRPTSVYVTPPLELSDDEDTEEDHKLEQHSNSTLTPLSSVKSNTTLKQDHHHIQKQHPTTIAPPSLTASTPPTTSKQDDLSFFKPPPKVTGSEDYLQPVKGEDTSEPSSPSSTTSSTSRRILSSPARLMKRLSMRLRSGSDVGLETKNSTANTKPDASFTPPTSHSSIFDSRPSSFEQTLTNTQEDKRSDSSSVRVKVSLKGVENKSNQEHTESKSGMVSDSGSPRRPDTPNTTLVESPLASLANSSSESSPNSITAIRNTIFQIPSTNLKEKLENTNYYEEETSFYDSTFVSKESMISIKQNSELHESVTQTQLSSEEDDDIFRTPPQFRGSEVGILDELSPPSMKENSNGLHRSINNVFESPSKKSQGSDSSSTTKSLDQSPRSSENVFESPSRKSQISSSSESNPYLRLNIYLEDSQSTPPPSPRDSPTYRSISSQSDNHDFIAIKLRKDKLQNINELVNVIIFKIMSKKPNVKVNDINLSIFFKNSHLKPILLKEQVNKRSSLSSIKGVHLDNDGLLLDYVQLKRKLYIRAQF